MQLVRVPEVQEHFKNFVLLDILMRQCDFIVISLYRAFNVVLFLILLGSGLRTPIQSPKNFTTAQDSAHVKIIVYSVPASIGVVFKLVYSLFQK